MSSIRVQKVEALLREQLSVLIRENLSEKFGMITVTSVAAAADFKQATVFIVLTDRDQEYKVLPALAQKTPAFQRVLGKALTMRNTPRLVFKIDQSETKINRLEELLKEINRDA